MRGLHTELELTAVHGQVSWYVGMKLAQDETYREIEANATSVVDVC